MVTEQVSNLLTPIADYFAAKLAEHGAEPRGADWNGPESQNLRFQQLCKVIRVDAPFSINDLGCGYGALLDYLSARYPSFDYLGTDISVPMIEAARSEHWRCPNAAFHMAAEPHRVADYGIASGIFNIRLDNSDEAWFRYLCGTLNVLDRTSRLGFAFNCLTSYSDAEKKRPELYYAEPARLLDHCMRHYSRHVALLHDYGLYDFTVLVRKCP